MNLSSNIKDTLTTIAGICTAVSGGIFLAQSQGLVLPSWVTSAAIALATVAAVCTMILTGKAPDGSTKPPTVVAAQNKEVAVAVAIEVKKEADIAVVEATKKT